MDFRDGVALWGGRVQGHPQGVPLRGAGACLKQDLMDCDGFSGWGWRCGVHQGHPQGVPLRGHVD